MKKFLKEDGQIAVIFALVLPVMIGVGALAVDFGHVFVSKNVMQNAADAAARAGAVDLAAGLTENVSATSARNLSNANLNSYGSLAGANSVVTFPTPTSIRVTVTHNVPLVLAPVIGIRTASVSATSLFEFSKASTIPGGFLAPLAVYCNNPAGCVGSLQPGVEITTRRYCGNYFMAGPEGNLCGNDIGTGEIFTLGVTLDDDNSNATFSNQVYDGYGFAMDIGQILGALPANRNGWRNAMKARLDEGRNKFILPIVREVTNPESNFKNLMIADFVFVEVSNFSITGNTDQMTFTIVEGVVPADGFSGDAPGVGVVSVSEVRMVE